MGPALTAAMPAIVGAVGSIAGGLLGGHSASRAQDAANRTNIFLQQRQQEWEERMANTEVQRRKADLEAAGFNPMLSFTSGQAASTPNVAPARVESTGTTKAEVMSRSISSAVQALALGAQSAQIEMAKAQARKTNAEAAVVENDPAASAANYEWRQTELVRRAQLLGAQIDKTAAETGMSMDTNERASQMFELLKKFQEVTNRGVELTNVEKKALADLYESVKGAKGLEKFGPLILSVLRR